MPRIAAFLILLSSASLSVAQTAPPGSVDYLTGGVGEVQRAEMAALPGYNLRVALANTAGEYLADADVRVLDTRGREVLSTHMDGPWLIARLPAGTYRIVATFAGEQRTQSVQVPASGQRQVVLRWNERALQSAAGQDIGARAGSGDRSMRIPER